MMGTKGASRSIRAGLSAGTCSIQSDKNFSHTYGIGGFDDFVHRSEVYLTGLNERNFFDLRFMRFEVQEDVVRRSNPDAIATTSSPGCCRASTIPIRPTSRSSAAN